MFEIGKDFSWRIREKRARERISISEAANRIGISRRTLSLIESEQSNKVKRTVYKKLVDWLVNEKIYKEV
jgi:DNA-binding XRE family transcriptional regulator